MRKPRIRRAPRPREPRGVERQYAAALAALTADMTRAVKVALREPLERAARLEQEAREDAPSDPFAEIDWTALRLRLGRITDRGAAIVDRFSRRIRDFNSGTIGEILKIDLAKEPPAVRAALEAWRRENVGLITSIGESLHADVRDVVRAATTRGTRVETLAKQIEGRYGVSKSRAKLIARDQTMKHNADLSKIRQAEAGITRYVWSTSRDERVRGNPGGKWPEGMHYGLEGRIFSWDDPPVTNKRGDRNHPGTDFQCRCTAIPVLDD